MSRSLLILSSFILSTLSLGQTLASNGEDGEGDVSSLLMGTITTKTTKKSDSSPSHQGPYSDDDASCSADGLTPGVCALSCLANPARPWSPKLTGSAEQQQHFKRASLASSNKSLEDIETSLLGAEISAEAHSQRLKNALMSEVKTAMSGKHTGFSATRLKHLEKELYAMFKTLPQVNNLPHGGLGISAARFLLHTYFVRTRRWYVRGLNPAGDGRREESPTEALRSRVAARLLEVVEKAVGSRGLNLHQLSIFIATMEHLIYGDELERLRAAWNVVGLKLHDLVNATQMAVVLEIFMAHVIYVSQEARSAYALTLDGAANEVKVLERTYDGWPVIKQDVAKAALKRSKFLMKDKHLSFEDCAKSAFEVLENFNKLSADLCVSLKSRFAQVEGGKLGRIAISKLRSASSAHLIGGFFRESEDYLREIGALDESDPKNRYLILPNYMTGPSNCDGSTSFYDLCCPNTCQAHMARLEKLEITQGKEAANVFMELWDMTDEEKHKLGYRAGIEVDEKVHEELDAIEAANSGQIPLHGRSFANLLHRIFPSDCPKPRAKDFAGADGEQVPDSHTDVQGTALMASFERPHEEAKKEFEFLESLRERPKLTV
eukprot:TRINITY_DN1247_c1_g2_i3.p1 TRINITY_DN1247_c1_g2~~TRINITY_DN1247_c1_g2_i3.p1  ORF type:complete len:606 (-),score=120.28 TRINITY_DN1247_c1_g2_i3:188-2005(-)